ncbi:MAG: RNA polymerase sigma factor [Gammaproteobacteria bacterium]|nr:RNA polymerase sigma factor [Gammaproteobacteria bacterium]
MKVGKTSAVLDAFQSKERLIRAFVRRFFNDAHILEDICQETITRALEAEKVRRIEKPDAFVFGVARNIVRTQLDVQSRSVLDLVDEFAPEDIVEDGPSVEQTASDRERMQRFVTSVLKLPRQCQRVFILKKVYGYSHREISAKLGISISTIEKHVAAGMKRCREDFDDASVADLAVVTTTFGEGYKRA